jgi:hypothetical protein
MMGTALGRFPSSRTMLRMVRLLFIAVLAAGCALVQPASEGPLVTVETTGGMCRTGPCRSVIAIEADGRVHQIEPQASEISRVTSESIDVLQTAIDITDFEAIRSQPFLGTCPTAFDGQELVYTLATPHGVERIASCDVEVDPQAPLFVAIHAILGASVPVPAP